MIGTGVGKNNVWYETKWRNTDYCPGTVDSLSDYTIDLLWNGFFFFY